MTFTEPVPGKSPDQSKWIARARTSLQTSLQNTRERITGIVKRDRYETASTNILNVFKAKTEEHPNMALTLSLQGKDSSGDESCVLHRTSYGAAVDSLWISLKKGDEIVALSLGSGVGLQVRKGDFTA